MLYLLLVLASVLGSSAGVIVDPSDNDLSCVANVTSSEAVTLSAATGVVAQGTIDVWPVSTNEEEVSILAWYSTQSYGDIYEKSLVPSYTSLVESTGFAHEKCTNVKLEINTEYYTTSVIYADGSPYMVKGSGHLATNPPRGKLYVQAFESKPVLTNTLHNVHDVPYTFERTTATSDYLILLSQGQWNGTLQLIGIPNSELVASDLHNNISLTYSVVEISSGDVAPWNLQCYSRRDVDYVICVQCVGGTRKKGIRCTVMGQFTDVLFEQNGTFATLGTVRPTEDLRITTTSAQLFQGVIPIPGIRPLQTQGQDYVDVAYCCVDSVSKPGIFRHNRDGNVTSVEFSGQAYTVSPPGCTTCGIPPVALVFFDATGILLCLVSSKDVVCYNTYNNKLLHTRTEQLYNVKANFLRRPYAIDLKDDRLYIARAPVVINAASSPLQIVSGLGLGTIGSPQYVYPAPPTPAPTNAPTNAPTAASPTSSPTPTPSPTPSPSVKPCPGGTPQAPYMLLHYGTSAAISFERCMQWRSDPATKETILNQVSAFMVRAGQKCLDRSKPYKRGTYQMVCNKTTGGVDIYASETFLVGTAEELHTKITTDKELLNYAYISVDGGARYGLDIPTSKPSQPSSPTQRARHTTRWFDKLSKWQLILIIIGGGLLLVVPTIAIIVACRRRRKRKLAEQFKMGEESGEMKTMEARATQNPPAAPAPPPAAPAAQKPQAEPPAPPPEHSRAHHQQKHHPHHKKHKGHNHKHHKHHKHADEGGYSPKKHAKAGRGERS